tara:strand:- start:172 stop:2436 length:2265 start_codon:yes stop_codon:yes gene_type:complete
MANPTYSAQFEEILNAAKERRGDLPIDTMIVASHLAQMRTFVLRRGVEFYCEQDSYGKRKEFLAGLYEDNMLEMKLDSIIDYFLCDGQGLFYFRPSGETYQILYFAKNQYRTFRNQENELDKVELIYDFNVAGKGFMDPNFRQPGQRGRKKYIKLEVFKDKITQTVSDERIQFDDENNGIAQMSNGGQKEELTNTLGFIPAIEIFNYIDCTGEADGRGEFDWLANQILGHDDLVRNIRKNMKFFGNPTLVSSRPKHDIVDAESDNSMRPTISSQAGFAAMGRPSTKATAPFGGASPLDGQIKVPRVIANLEPTDRVNYLTPDSVSGDQNMYVKQYRSEIRLALGGVDDIDINLASTAYEIKTLYGRVAATAEKKARSMFTFGLCRLMAMIISHEEYIFNESFASAMGLVKPIIPIEEENFESPEAFQEEMQNYQVAMQQYIATRNELFRATLETGEMPEGVTGLIPDGSTRVSWRWLGEVFEEDTQDILNNSIVVRNLQELGVDSIEALKYLFPGKTEEERAAMLTGYPFRMVQQTQQSLSSFIGLLGNLYQLPHPQAPNLPLASDPNLDITGFLYRSLEFLRKELSYSGRYQPSSDGDTPDTLSDADRRRASLGLPIRDNSAITLPGVSGDNAGGLGESGTPGLQPGTGPAGFGSGPLSGQSMAGSVPGSVRKPEYAQSLPNPGTVLGLSDADASSKYPGAMGFTPGAADLQSGSFNPSLFGAGTGAAASAAAGPGARADAGSAKPKPKRKRK